VRPFSGTGRLWPPDNSGTISEHATNWRDGSNTEDKVRPGT
jgi:hypothetical protein